MELENLGYHCWKEGPRVISGEFEECGSTCMLSEDHEGDHEFTPNNEITIRFAEGE